MRTLVERVGRLQRLAAFEAAARLGSFTGAARELGMTQPGATRHIRALETELGVSLFERRSNRVALSAAGRRLYESVSQGFAVIESALDRIVAAADGFVLAANPGVAQRWLVPHLDQGLLVPVGPEVRHATFGYYLFWPKGRRRETVRHLADWLKTLIAR